MMTGVLRMSSFPSRSEMIEAAVALLLREGYGPITRPREVAPRECSVCGVKDEDEYLTPIEVAIAQGEEGSSQVTMYRCQEHLAEIQEGLVALGFVTHEHGSTAYLEDGECPGAIQPKQCLHRAGYGPVILTQSGFWQAPEHRWEE